MLFCMSNFKRSLRSDIFLRRNSKYLEFKFSQYVPIPTTYLWNIHEWFWLTIEKIDPKIEFWKESKVNRLQVGNGLSMLKIQISSMTYRRFESLFSSLDMNRRIHGNLLYRLITNNKINTFTYIYAKLNTYNELLKFA